MTPDTLIQEVRRRHGLSIAALAEKLGYRGKGTVGDAERGIWRAGPAFLRRLRAAGLLEGIPREAFERGGRCGVCRGTGDAKEPEKTKQKDKRKLKTSTKDRGRQGQVQRKRG